MYGQRRGEEEFPPFPYKLKKKKKVTKPACLVENKLVQFCIHVFTVQTFGDSDVKCASGLLCVLFSFLTLPEKTWATVQADVYPIQQIAGDAQ